MRRNRKHRLHGEAGASLVIVAGGMVTFLLCAVFAVDVANWFVHERHLQTQADAAALAGVDEIHYPSCNDAAVLLQARAYAGLTTDPAAPTETRNPQVGGTPATNIHMGAGGVDKLNTPAYFSFPSPVNGAASDDSPTSSPCTSGVVDVKLTETGVGSFIPSPFTPAYINVHARAEVRQRKASDNAAPIGIPDSSPQEVWAWLIDENGTKCGGVTSPRCVVASRQLTRTGPLAGGLTGWSTPALSPLSPAFAGVGSSLSLVVAMSGNKTGTLTGVLATDCAKSLVQCVDASGGSPPGVGVPFIHTYSTTSVASTDSPYKPAVRDVRLSPVSCAAPDAYVSVPCTSGTEQVRVTATVDFDSSVTTDPRGASGTDVGLTAFITGGANKGYDMTYDTTAKTWSAAVPVTAAGAGDVSISWNVARNKFGCTANSGCTGSFGVVQRAYSATAATAGPIRLAQIGEPSGPAAYVSVGANSFPRCAASATPPNNCAHDLSVTIGISGNLKNDSLPTDPPITLRLGSSQTGLVQCDPRTSVDPTGDLAMGCSRNGVRYTKFTGAAPWNTGCPNNSSNLGSYPFDWQCVGTQNGATPSAISNGLNARMFCGGNASGCSNAMCKSINYWKDPVRGIAGKIDATDPRVVTLFITPFGSFQGSGSETFPIQEFGTFYITGWQGPGSSSNPCQPGQPGAPTGIYADDVAQNGEVVGHYFKSVDDVDNGEAGDDPCDPNAFGGCVAIITR